MRPKPIAELIGLLAVAWCVMVLTHELGHIVGGWLGGATLIACDLRPWRLPHSLHQPDPHPLVTLWSGPLLGAVVPPLAALAVRGRRAWFVADFCVLANGAYLALAWLLGDRHLDTPRLLEAGAPAWTIAAYCLATIGVGYARFRRDCLAILAPPGGGA